nr:leucyl aminopeptidase family protein [Natronosporangium hydrolyticum]
MAPGAEGAPATLVAPARPVPEQLAVECAAMVKQAPHRGGAGSVSSLPRPLGKPHRVLLVGVGGGAEGDWRAAGAALARAASRETALTVSLPAEVGAPAVRGLAEGLLLASYRYRLGADPPGQAPQLRRVAIQVDDPGRYQAALATAQAVAEVTAFARDLTNAPAAQKTPAWFVRQVTKLAAKAGPASQLKVRAREVAELRRDGFGGILAVGAGSVNPPRLLEVSWRPRGAGQHVALVGKGITFDTGGISLKPAAAMKLMRKDMAGGAAVAAAALGAARLRLPVRVTALVPLAENMVGGAAQRPGDVIRHWGGKTSEVRNTDAEGRLVLADALAYAATRLRPDRLVDLATLTGANAVALGKRTGALYSEDADLAGELAAAAAGAGERVWRMPLVEDYIDALGSDLADLNNAPEGGAGSVLAALYLREFTGAARSRWAHIDMSAPSWAERDDGELSRGATGWGVRTLLRWLGSDVAIPEE